VHIKVKVKPLKLNIVWMKLGHKFDVLYSKISTYDRQICCSHFV